MRILRFAVLAGAIATEATAQDVVVTCRPQETVSECGQRYRPTGSDSILADTSTVDVARRLQAKAVGPDLSSAGPLSAISDFLPRLATSLLAPASSGAAPELGFKLNLPMNDGALLNLGITGQISTVFHQPKLFGEVADSLVAGIDNAARTQLQGGLEPFDDAEVTGAINLENTHLGRSLRPHHDVIQALALALVGELASTNPESDAADLRFVEFQSRMRKAPNVLTPGSTNPKCRVRDTVADTEASRDFGEVPVSCLTPAGLDAVQAAIADIAGATARYLRNAAARLNAAGFVHLAQLVNNQPQLNFSWEIDPRASIVGPSQWNGRARFELGFANMNGLRRFCRGPVTSACLQRYVNDARVAGSLSRADRVFAQLDVTRRNAWQVNLPAQSLNRALPAATSLTFSGGYGAYIGNAADNENRDRLDLQTKLELTRDDPVREDRWVSSLFYTRHVTGQATALIGLTWANRPEFVGDVTRHLGANIGFTYKLNQDPASAAGQK